MSGAKVIAGTRAVDKQSFAAPDLFGRLEPLVKGGKGGVGEGGTFLSVGRTFLAALFLEVAGVFVVMAVEA